MSKRQAVCLLIAAALLLSAAVWWRSTDAQPEPIPEPERDWSGLKAQLDSYSDGTNLALSDNRFNYLYTMGSYEEYNRYIKHQPKNLNKYTVIEAKIEDIDYIKSLQKQRRLARSKKK